MPELEVARGGRVATLLPAATTTGVGAGIDLTYARGTFTMQTVVTGAPATVSVKLQGSLDNVNWSDLATSSSTTGDQQYAVDKPQRFIRANVVTLTGGTAPTVTVFAIGI